MIEADGAEASIPVVEDEILVLMDIEDAVMALGGGPPTCFSSAARAREWLLSNRPAFAIIDYRLIDETSEELAAVLKAKQVPFVVYSGNDHDVGGHSGIFDKSRWLRKPANQDQLVQAMREAMFE